MTRETNVVIIGAGSAGLSAAKTLAQSGVSFILLEGSHRIGGRAYSEELAPGVWFDLGCSYLHQADNNPFVAIADDLGHAIGRDWGDIFDDECIGLHQNGRPLSESERRAYHVYQNTGYAAIDDSAARGEDVAIATLIDLEHEYALPFLNDASATLGCDVDLASAADAAAWEEGPDYPLLNGYGNLIAAWGGDVPVALNTRVDRVEWSCDGVKVSTSKGDIRARVVLCTVSTGVLAAGDIDFAPALPDWKLEAIAGLPLGVENKIGVLFDHDVFGTDGRGYHETWNDDEQAGSLEASVMGLNVAVVFSGGRLASWLEKQGQQACRDFALDRIAEVFGNDIRKHVIRTIATAWETDPWTRGSYSCALPGQAYQRTELARSIDNRLFFAGEATTIEDHATCHGAFNSGRRAASEIFQALEN